MKTETVHADDPKTPLQKLNGGRWRLRQKKSHKKAAQMLQYAGYNARFVEYKENGQAEFTIIIEGEIPLQEMSRINQFCKEEFKNRFLTVKATKVIK